MGFWVAAQFPGLTNSIAVPAIVGIVFFLMELQLGFHKFKETVLQLTTPNINTIIVNYNRN